ncbi:MAG: dialkylresorcinol condensing enzyme [Gammaproteobacteria bacterium]|nr:dialkylresorcinol condensing enzyme [Gammaproteobacteria bacterium]
MRNVLVIHYSQTGQLTRISESVIKPLQDDPQINVDLLELKPEQAFPFPWPFLSFFHVFPESVKMQPIPMQHTCPPRLDYDLIILCYQVWFLSPSLPTSSFLQSELAASLFKNTPVVTVIGCRGMWLSAQEKVKCLLENLQATLVDNVVLTDQCGAGFSFLATPLWMFTGRKKSYSWVPKAGVSDQEIAQCDRFGEAIATRLNKDPSKIEQPMLKGLAAVTINEKFIASERVGQHSFRIWSKIISAFGPMYSLRRSCGLMLYVIFLVTLILTVVPISALIKRLIAPLTKKRIATQKAYFSEPSGE